MSARRAAARIALATVALLAVSAALLTGASSAASVAAAHVHALGFDPADGSLLFGTHGGLYRLGQGDKSPRKVGSISYDLMGLAAVGPRTYVASGHPDAEAAARSDLPSNLGLIRSDDGGKQWRAVSLAGADFHVLRARDQRILAFDVAGSRLLASTNGGRTWSSRVPPAGAVDLALGPKPGAVAASTSAGVMVSADGGVKYRPAARKVGPGLVAWPTQRMLILVDGAGVVRVSSNEGRTFSRRGTAGGAPAALAVAGKKVAVLLDTGAVKLSSDGGRWFSTVPAP